MDPFGRFAARVAEAAGSAYAFALALVIVLAWASIGLARGFDDSWLLVMNTVATVVTFLMVFLIQQSNNRHTAAVQLKLNELLAAIEGASNRLIGAERLPEGELEDLHERFLDLRAAGERDPHARTSIERAARRDEDERAPP